MPVGTFEQPDFETQTPTGYKGAIDNSIAAHHRLAGAFAPHEHYEGSPSALTMKVAIDAGMLRTGTTRTEVAAQQTAALTAPVGNPRIDLVYIDGGTGTVGVATGTPAGSPVAPACPAGKVPIVEVALATTTTAITNQLLTDRRALYLTEVQTADIEDSAVTGAKIADGAAVKIPGGTALKIKEINIGDWNMDTTNSVAIAHGLTLSKIRSVSALIINDAGTQRTAIAGFSLAIGSGVSINAIDATVVNLSRELGGIFDSANYDSTGFNRGHVIITYDENG